MNKRTYLTFGVLAATGLLIAVICVVGVGSFDSGGRIMVVCSLLAEAGLVYFGSRWFRLATSIGKIAEGLAEGKLLPASNRRDCLLDQLAAGMTRYFQGINTCIADAEERYAALQIKLQLLRREKSSSDAIIYSIHEAVLVADEFDRLVIANQAFADIFGFDLKKDLCKPLKELIGDAAKDLPEFLNRCRVTKENGARKEIQVNKGSQVSIFDCVVSCIFDEKRNVTAVVAVLHDVTREKEISQMKNDFVSHVSHELKTPLASILAYSELLVDGEANDEKTQKEFYDVIQSQAKRLNRLIEDILNTSRIESGLVKVDKKAISLELLIEEQLKMIKSYAEEKDIEVTWGSSTIGNGSKGIVVFGQVYADRDMISQVIVNLLSNAIKYTKSGGTVKVTSEVDDNRQIARVSVTDSGVGIPENEIGRVFDKFYRVEANKKQAKGTGLGLNLVKQIVESIHGGSVFVTSEVGKGSTFGFELPLATRDVVEQYEHV